MFTDKKIIIVENSYTIRYEIKLLLEKIGVEVIEAANGLTMHNLMEKYGESVDLVIMDLGLKYESGFDLIKSLRASDKYANIPIMILTKNATKENVLKAKQLKVKEYLRKPIQKDELIKRVTNILQKNS